MTVAEFFLLSAALGTDLFSVAIPAGMNRVRLRVVLWAALVFAIFHIIMILAGYHAGHWLGALVEHVSTYHVEWPVIVIENWASGIGAIVLAGLGLHMIKNNLAGRNLDTVTRHPLQGMPLVMLAVSVSIDALAAGFSMGMMDVDLVKLSVVLGGVIFIIALLGLILGRRFGRYIGARAELVGGTILVFLGIHYLWTTLS